MDLYIVLMKCYIHVVLISTSKCSFIENLMLSCTYRVKFNFVPFDIFKLLRINDAQKYKISVHWKRKCPEIRMYTKHFRSCSKLLLTQEFEANINLDRRAPHFSYTLKYNLQHESQSTTIRCLKIWKDFV